MPAPGVHRFGLHEYQLVGLLIKWRSGFKGREWLSMQTVQEIALTPCYQHPLWDVTGPVIGEEVIFWERKIFVVL